MSSTRRDFLQRSASTAAALSLGPLAGGRVAGALETAARAPGAAGATGAPAGPDSPAAIRAFEARLLRARPLPLQQIRVTGGPLKHAQDLDVAYLLELEPDRMLSSYRTQAGLP